MCGSDSSERDRMEGRVVRWKHLGCSAILRKVQEGHWGKILCQRDMTFPGKGLPYYSCGAHQGAVHGRVASAQMPQRTSERSSGGRRRGRRPAARDLGGQILHPSYKVTNPDPHKLFICLYPVSYQERLKELYINALSPSKNPLRQRHKNKPLIGGKTQGNKNSYPLFSTHQTGDTLYPYL